MVLLLLIVQVTCLRVLFLPKSHQDLTTAVVKLKIVITLELLFVLFHSESVGTLIRALAFSCESLVSRTLYSLMEPYSTFMRVNVCVWSTSSSIDQLTQ